MMFFHRLSLPPFPPKLGLGLGFPIFFPSSPLCCFFSLPSLHLSSSSLVLIPYHLSPILHPFFPLFFFPLSFSFLSSLFSFHYNLFSCSRGIISASVIESKSVEPSEKDPVDAEDALPVAKASFLKQLYYLVGRFFCYRETYMIIFHPETNTLYNTFRVLPRNTV